MTRSTISLNPEITRDHALTLMAWLEDDEVTRYLSDSPHVSRFIAQVLERVHLPVLTHLFNQGGRFFMAHDRQGVPVGFVRLVKQGPGCEMVLVIGQRDQWGRKLGTGAIRAAIKLAFFEMRADKLVAKIHADNTRSLRAFRNCGFVLDGETPSLKVLALSRQRHLRLLQERPTPTPADIRITEIDRARLRDLIAADPAADLAELAHEVERAIVVDPRQVAPDVVTMNSRALLHVDDAQMEVALVYPRDADGGTGRLSICSAVGTAILGYQEGDTVDWRTAQGSWHIRIGKLLYQPEAAGDFHL